MSLECSINTPSKKEIAAILRSVADWIAAANNDRVVIDLKISFKEESKK